MVAVYVFSNRQFEAPARMGGLGDNHHRSGAMFSRKRHMVAVCALPAIVLTFYAQSPTAAATRLWVAQHGVRNAAGLLR